MTLAGQAAVVTGATSGIGRATAEALAGAGVKLVLGGRQEDKLAALAEALPDSVAVAGDMTDGELPGRLVERALSAHGRLDLCVNNAGTIAVGTIEDIDIDAVCRMARINVEAAYRMSYRALRHFRAAGSGHLVNISSVLGTKIRPTAGAYAGTKYAIEALSEALRMEVAGSPIKVSCIEPGLVMTELHRDLLAHPQDTLGVERPLAPADIARMVLFVAGQPDHVAVPRLMVLPQDQAI